MNQLKSELIDFVARRETQKNFTATGFKEVGELLVEANDILTQLGVADQVTVEASKFIDGIQVTLSRSFVTEKDLLIWALDAALAHGERIPVRFKDIAGKFMSDNGING